MVCEEVINVPQLLSSQIVNIYCKLFSLTLYLKQNMIYMDKKPQDFISMLLLHVKNVAWR